MAGGLGNDTYSVDNTGDVVTEASAAGADLVNSTVSYTLGANLEKLTLTGSAAINATGNTLANTLTGNGAANVLDGKTGADSMAGGLGNDTYVVDSTGDLVTELASGGTDLVSSSISYTLGANVEKLTLTGSAAINATGNTLANTLTGNASGNTLNGAAGNDTLTGGAGRDVLTGGAGNDVFDFNAFTESGLTTTTRDLITDFVRGTDRIDLSGIDANTTLTGDQAFSKVLAATVAFTAAGQLKLVSGVLYGNTDSDSTAEFSITLTGVNTLGTTDFVL